MRPLGDGKNFPILHVHDVHAPLRAAAHYDRILVHGDAAKLSPPNPEYNPNTDIRTQTQQKRVEPAPYNPFSNYPNQEKRPVTILIPLWNLTLSLLTWDDPCAATSSGVALVVSEVFEAVAVVSAMADALVIAMMRWKGWIEIYGLR